MVELGELDAGDQQHHEPDETDSPKGIRDPVGVCGYGIGKRTEAKPLGDSPSNGCLGSGSSLSGRVSTVSESARGTSIAWVGHVALRVASSRASTTICIDGEWENQ